MRKHVLDYHLKDTEFQCHEVRRVIELDGGDSCTAMWMDLILPNYTPEND